jgi:hypothetical protein
MVAVSRSRAGRFSVPVNGGRAIRHWHDKVLYLARAVTMRESLPGRQWITLGIWCPVCGFHPNATANEMQRVALEAVARKPAPSKLKLTS